MKTPEIITLSVAVLAAVASIAAAAIAARAARAGSRNTSTATRLAPIETARHNAQRTAYAEALTALYAHLVKTGSALPPATELEEAARAETEGGPPLDGPTVQNWRRRINDANDPDPVRLALAVVRLEGPGHIADDAKRVEEALEQLDAALRDCGTLFAEEGQPLHEAETQEPGTCATRHRALRRQVGVFTAKASAYLNSNPTDQAAAT
ncbi:hypothetical protein [Streptomyces triticirhizae]|uniref:hypothetical protein n=1 Tax=Streptomyces triticirhizae TaxID=2483353 RepID=UPI0011C46D67|nr:hypothetical protein [Streptomyces triticirhizae]